MLEVNVTEKDVLKALACTKYQRQTHKDCPEPAFIRSIFEQTPIPDTKFLHITDKIEAEVQTKLTSPPQKTKNAAPQKRNEDIYAELRRAQGISGQNQGPKRGVGPQPAMNYNSGFIPNQRLPATHGFARRPNITTAAPDLLQRAMNQRNIRSADIDNDEEEESF